MPRSGTEEEGGRKYNFRELYDNRMVRDQEPENNGGFGSSVLENGRSQAHGSREKH